MGNTNFEAILRHLECEDGLVGGSSGDEGRKVIQNECKRTEMLFEGFLQGRAGQEFRISDVVVHVGCCESQARKLISKNPMAERSRMEGTLRIYRSRAVPLEPTKEGLEEEARVNCAGREAREDFADMSNRKGGFRVKKF